MSPYQPVTRSINLTKETKLCSKIQLLKLIKKINKSKGSIYNQNLSSNTKIPLPHVT